MGLKKAKAQSLARGRPPLAKEPVSGLSSKATRSIIRKHHNLLKAQSQAQRSGDSAKADQIAKEIEANGGLEKYQKASHIGQLETRGGDTSKILVDWLQELQLRAMSESKQTAQQHVSVLEIGCLSPNNAISKFKEVDIVRIDLHSTDPAILEQDFMERPLPSSETERFDLISLSLVLNYVPDPPARGEMLMRTRDFLRPFPSKDMPPSNGQKCLPALFLTLPRPCVDNSRYMTKEHLNNIMSSLGYRLVREKFAAKIYYSLWGYDAAAVQNSEFKKVEISPGGGKNNFGIVLRHQR
jgi:25S rRNA (adenine2142-N1)-methyltransferase